MSQSIDLSSESSKGVTIHVDSLLISTDSYNKYIVSENESKKNLDLLRIIECKNNRKKRILLSSICIASIFLLLIILLSRFTSIQSIYIKIYIVCSTILLLLNVFLNAYIVSFESIDTYYKKAYQCRYYSNALMWINMICSVIFFLTVCISILVDDNKDEILISIIQILVAYVYYMILSGTIINDSELYKYMLTNASHEVSDTAVEIDTQQNSEKCNLINETIV
jgi:hypothetical protein